MLADLIIRYMGWREALWYTRRSLFREISSTILDCRHPTYNVIWSRKKEQLRGNHSNVSVNTTLADGIVELGAGTPAGTVASRMYAGTRLDIWSIYSYWNSTQIGLKFSKSHESIFCFITKFDQRYHGEMMCIMSLRCKHGAPWCKAGRWIVSDSMLILIVRLWSFVKKDILDTLRIIYVFSRRNHLK